MKEHCGTMATDADSDSGSRLLSPTQTLDQHQAQTWPLPSYLSWEEPGSRAGGIRRRIAPEPPTHGVVSHLPSQAATFEAQLA